MYAGEPIGLIGRTDDLPLEEYPRMWRGNDEAFDVSSGMHEAAMGIPPQVRGELESYIHVYRQMGTLGYTPAGTGRSSCVVSRDVPKPQSGIPP